MNVAPHLRRSPDDRPAAAALLPGRDPGPLLSLCARLGLDPSGRVFDVSGGFLLRLEVPTRLPLPGAVRLRALAADLLLPADADLVPALLDDEASGLVRDRGLVFLPGGRVLAFDPKTPVPIDRLLAAEVSPARGWSPLPEAPALAPTLTSVVIDRPMEDPDDLFDAGDGAGVGTEAPRPDESGAAANLLGRASLGLGRGMAWLGKAFGSNALSAAGASWVERAMRLAPRISEDVLGRQAAALRDLLREFREGDADRALRRALPLADPGEERGATPYDGDTLPNRSIAYGLGDILGGPGRSAGPASTWLGGQDVMAELTREYRKAADAALRAGDFRRAAAIYGKLLRDYRSAASALMRGGLFHDAAVIYLAKLDDRRGAAQAYVAAGEIDRAVQLYRREGDHEAAGDLLRREGEEVAAVAEYVLAADRLAATDLGLLAAGDLLLSKAGRPDLASVRFAAGWSRRPAGNALTCALRLARLRADGGDASGLLALVDQADAFFQPVAAPADVARFYNEVAGLADAPPLASARDDLRDRALAGLADHLRGAAESGFRVGGLVTSLLGAAGRWSPSLVSDADFAAADASRPEPPPTPPPLPSPRGARRFRVGQGTVTALAFAADTGDVFLGFAGGEVFSFRAEFTEVVHVATYDVPVASLATDPAGKFLVVLRADGGGRGVLSSYERRVPHGSFRLLVGITDERLERPWLTPVTPEDGAPQVGLWNGGNLAIVDVETLTALSAFESRDGDDGDSPAGLLLNGRWDDPKLLVHDGREWVTRTSADDPGRGSGLGWCPGLPESSSLRSVPLSVQARGDDLDLAGVDSEGGLTWARLHDGDMVATNRASAADGGFLAAAVVRDGLVAGVTARRVYWLRTGPHVFARWKTSEFAVPAAVACAPCHQTGELVIACQDGFVARLPLPV